MKKIFLLFAAMVLMATMLTAAPVTKETAATICHNFLLQKQANGQTDNSSFQYYKTNYFENTAVYHIFTFDKVGFIAISASDNFTPVLCYSFESDYMTNPAFDFAMNIYSRWISYCEKHEQVFENGVTEQWQRYLSPSFDPTPTRAPVVAELLRTRWNQDLYFNTLCPWDIHASYGCDGHVYTGCVSTAMSQVMNYYGHPYSGLGGSSYIPAPYGRYTVKFYEQTYNYDAMPNVPFGYSNEMAKLIHHCGVAVQMGYTTQGSGAQSIHAITAMRTNFKYDYAILKERGEWDLDNISYWLDTMKTELDKLRPLYYAANDGEGGHAFVVDGYDEDSKFHVNWGWGGGSNGYFTISDNNHSDMLGFIYGAEAGFYNYPVTDAPAPLTGNHRNDAATGTIASNMPHVLYAPNTECQWMLAAPEATRYTIQFDRFETEEGHDIVTVYNGPTTADGVAGTFSGSAIPSNLTINADSVLITFTTDGENEFHGFQISYTTQGAAQYCSEQEIITADSPVTITDGSGDNSYRNNSVCTWKINTANMSHCYFSFPQIELGNGDFIEIYNNTTNPATLLYRFDNRNYPTSDVLDCRYGRVMVRFVADNWDTGNGFTMTAQPVTKVNDYANVGNLNVYPNPATDMLNLQFTTANAEMIRCDIVDMNGKCIKSIERQHDGGLFEESVNVSDIAAGIYFLRIRTQEGTTMQKFIKEAF